MTERIHPDDAVGCAAAEAACRRRHNLTVILLGTLADSGRTSFADDRRLFMAWQITRLLAPSWNEPPAWFVQRHIEYRRDIEHKGTQSGRARGGLRPHPRLSTRTMRVLVVLLGNAVQVILPRSVADVRHRRVKLRYTAFSGWSPGRLADDVSVTSEDHVHDKHCLGWKFDPRRVLEAV